MLWALALEGLPADKQEELLALATPHPQPLSRKGRGEPESPDFRSPTPDSRFPTPESRLARVRHLYDQAGVFDKANRLIEKHQERAEKIADEIEPEELRALLYYLIDSVLDHAGRAAPVPLLTTIG